MHDINIINAQNAAAEKQHADGIERAATRMCTLVYEYGSEFTWETEVEEIREDARMLVREIIKSYNRES